MLYDTITQYDEAIEITRDAMNRVLLVGEEHSIETNANAVKTQEIQLRMLRQHLSILTTERDKLRVKNVPSIIHLRAGW